MLIVDIGVPIVVHETSPLLNRVDAASMGSIAALAAMFRQMEQPEFKLSSLIPVNFFVPSIPLFKLFFIGISSVFFHGNKSVKAHISSPVDVFPAIIPTAGAIDIIEDYDWYECNYLD